VFCNWVKYVIKSII